MKHFRLAFFFLLCSQYANAQLALAGRTYFFEGALNTVFSSGIGAGINYCSSSYDLDSWESTGIFGFSYTPLSARKDTFPTEAYINDSLIAGSWEKYYDIKLYQIDFDFVWALRDDNLLKPFAGFALNVPIIEYNYMHNVPGVISEDRTNENIVGLSTGPVAGAWIYFSERIGGYIKAEQQWGIFLGSAAGDRDIFYFDVSAGVIFNFQ